MLNDKEKALIEKYAIRMSMNVLDNKVELMAFRAAVRAEYREECGGERYRTKENSYTTTDKSGMCPTCSGAGEIAIEWR